MTKSLFHKESGMQFFKGRFASVITGVTADLPASEIFTLEMIEQSHLFWDPAVANRITNNLGKRVMFHIEAANRPDGGAGSIVLWINKNDAGAPPALTSLVSAFSLTDGTAFVWRTPLSCNIDMQQGDFIQFRISTNVNRTITAAETLIIITAVDIF